MTVRVVKNNDQPDSEGLAPEPERSPRKGFRDPSRRKSGVSNEPMSGSNPWPDWAEAQRACTNLIMARDALSRFEGGDEFAGRVEALRQEVQKWAKIGPYA